MKKSQAGFTLVELVVVILILGILGATALPRFMNVNAQAHTAAVAGAGGGFGAGAALVHAQWIANASTTAVNNVNNFGNNDVDVNGTGWPTSVASNLSTIGGAAAQCVEVWNGIMQNPPTVLASATPCAADYCATSAAEACTYTYNAVTTKNIAYNATTGAVVVTNP